MLTAGLLNQSRLVAVVDFNGTTWPHSEKTLACACFIIRTVSASPMEDHRGKDRDSCRRCREVSLLGSRCNQLFFAQIEVDVLCLASPSISSSLSPFYHFPQIFQLSLIAAEGKSRSGNGGEFD